MKINGLPINDGGLQRIGNKRTEKTPAEKPKKSDIVEISQSHRNGDIEVHSQYTLPDDFPARVERVKSVARRVVHETYTMPDVQKKIAERIIESAALSDTVSYIASGVTETPPVRSEMVNMAHDNVLQNYYDQPEVLEEIAGRLIDALGLSSLF